MVLGAYVVPNSPVSFLLYISKYIKIHRLNALIIVSLYP